MIKIVLIDDNQKYREEFTKCFKTEFEVISYSDAEVLNNNQTLLNLNFDALIIDLLMPAIDGLSLWTTLKSQFKSLPSAFIISEKNEAHSRELALKMGLTDYLHKEMSQNEISLRIKNRLHNKNNQDSETLQSDNLSLDLRDMSCIISNESVHLTKIEFQILRFLLEQKKFPTERIKLVNFVWSNKIVRNQTLNSHLFNLNEKLSLWTRYITVDKNSFVHCQLKHHNLQPNL